MNMRIIKLTEGANRYLMKKTALASILVIFGISLFCPSAGAYPVSVGDYIYITSSGPLGGGGEIEVVNKANGFVFQSFCLERHEIVLQGSNNPYLVYDLSGSAMSGGGGAVDGKDELSGATKWLYYNYWTGELASDYGYDGVGRKTGQGALQLAIWYLEGETNKLQENDGEKNWDGRNFYNLAMKHSKEGESLPVVAMNIQGPYNAGDKIGEGQSMLVVVTPEPWTIILLGTGLISLAMIRRNRRLHQAE
jgi:hypothetical protein